jgi:CRISPR/Cas system CMR-associated protein Cmr1 (group 7 of RAMP superfamily)
MNSKAFFKSTMHHNPTFCRQTQQLKSLRTTEEPNFGIQNRHAQIYQEKIQKHHHQFNCSFTHSWKMQVNPVHFTKKEA